MTDYRRYRLQGGCYFFTVALAERQSRLLTENIQGLRTACREVQQVHPFTMDAVVILPDHLHCIWTLPKGDDDFSTRWRQIKAAFSRPKTERRFKSRLNKGERGSGSGGFGRMRYGMRWITGSMSITSITTRSSMSMFHAWQIGHFRRFTDS